jgi:hypothetical protein
MSFRVRSALDEDTSIDASDTRIVVVGSAKHPTSTFSVLYRAIARTPWPSEFGLSQVDLTRVDLRQPGEHRPAAIVNLPL